ncbi:integrase [Burkholderia sp. Ac-20384]|uniref:site-specific integrase n=1 Tax=Burkholderia sp. Ac-20384 TaxID=2703902 RepID=UPI001980B7E5|nr:site-specific integrase [Burkholderia sp. Ac-20384]MBN3823672.1 integrase [Burkholderia sp. Ac-20384]
MHKLPRLYRSRHGVYYLRVIQNKRKIRRSLGTKDFHQARISALSLNLQLAMAEPFDLNNKDLRKLDLNISPTGEISFKDIKADDVGIVKDILQNMGFKSEAQFDAALDDKKAAFEAANPGLTAEAMGAQMGKIVRASMALPVAEQAAYIKREKAAFIQQHQQQSQAPKQISEKFSAVVTLYLNEKKLDNVPKTLYDKERIYNEFQSFFGDLDINAYTPQEAIAYKNRLIGKAVSASGINARCSFMRSLFEYAADNNLYFTTNPFERVKISTKAKLKQQVKSYQPFTEEELAVVFEESAYRAFMDKPDYYWLPFLALYTGARLEELTSLPVDRIFKADGVWVFDIQEDVAKNINSVRKIPIPEVVLQSGFFDYIESVKASGGIQLFPHLTKGKNGYSRNTSRRFGQYLDTRGITDERKVFHSFRSNFINAVTNENVHPAIIMGLVGHYEQGKIDFSSPHFKHYQKKKPLEILKDAIDKASFPIKLFW